MFEGNSIRVTMPYKNIEVKIAKKILINKIINFQGFDVIALIIDKQLTVIGHKDSTEGVSGDLPATKLSTNRTDFTGLHNGENYRIIGLHTEIYHYKVPRPPKIRLSKSLFKTVF